MTDEQHTSPGRDDLEHLEAILAQDPSSPEFDRLADAYTRAGRFLDAIRISKQGLKFHPDHAKGYVALGRALFGSGNLPQAVKVLWRSLDLHVTESEPFRLLGEILLWQTAPTEAVTVLERALELGFDEPSIQNVLHRALDAVEREKTGIVEHLQQKKRGIGNMAVAGTIGTTSHGMQAPLTAEVTQRVAFPQESADSVTPTMVRANAPDPAAEAVGREEPEMTQELMDVAAEGASGKSIDSEWSRQLDVQDFPSFPDVDSDVNTAHEGGHDTMPLAPLVDPLEEGIPPLPLDAADTGETLLVQEPRTVVDTFAPAFAHDVDDQVQTAVMASGMAHADTELALPAITQNHAEEPSTGTWKGPAADVPQAFDGEHPPITSLARDHQSEAPTLIHEPSAREEGMGLLSALTGEEGDVDEPGVTASQAALNSEDLFDMNEPGSRRTERQPRRSSRLFKVFLVLLLVGLGAGGVYFWRHISRTERNQDALKAAGRARVEDTFDTYQEVLAQLERTKARGDKSKELFAEIELITALQWLEHGARTPPALARGAGTNAHTLARAAMALANGEPWRVHTILGQFEGGRDDRALGAFLSAWAHWLEGHRTEAFQQVARSISLTPHTAAFLLKGHLHREIGALGEASAAYREALKISPRHALANLGLAAVLLEGKAAIEQIDEHLARPVVSPVEKAWHKVLRNEYKLLRVNPGGETHDLLMELNMTPPKPALLFQAIRVLMFAGQFDAAHAMLDRLKKIRSKRDAAMVLLESELLQAQGLEAKALRLIGSDSTEPQLRLSRAAALVWIRQPREALAEMAQVKEKVNGIYRRFASLQQDPGSSLAPLEAQATESSLAKLVLAAVLMQRGEATRAQEVLSELVNHPRYRLRALTFRATIYFEAGNLTEALANLGLVRRSSPQFMPAQELRGRIHLEAGRYTESVQLLGRVYTAGRRTLPLLISLAKGRALIGNATGAALLIEEIKALGASDLQVALLRAYLRLSEGQLPNERLSAEELKDRAFLVELGRLCQRKGKHDRAERVLKRALALDPHHPLPYLRLGQLFFEDDLRLAISYFEGAIKRSAKRAYFPPSFEVEAHLGVADSLLEEHRSGKKVSEHLLVAIKLDPSSSRAFQLIGRNFLSLKRWKQAREALEKSVVLDPENATAFYLLGHSARSKRKRAVQALRRFLKLEPDSHRADQARRELKKRR